MNGNCGPNPAASGMNLHQMGAFDKWFEGTGYQDGQFYDNEAENCPGWPWPESACMTPVNESTVGAGYLTSELGNRTIAWLKQIAAEPVRRPWFVYFATHAPHGEQDRLLETFLAAFLTPCVLHTHVLQAPPRPRNGTERPASVWSRHDRTRTSTFQGTRTRRARCIPQARPASEATAPARGGTPPIFLSSQAASRASPTLRSLKST